MSVEQGGRPRGELSSSQQRQPQSAEPQQGSPADTPLAPILQERQGGEAWSYAEMVTLIRREMAQYVERYRPSRFDQVAWMREQLTWQVAKKTVAVTGKNVDRQEGPHAMLLFAWDVISLPYYTNTYTRDLAEGAMQDDASVLGQTIAVDPHESKLLDAMAEACRIPITYGHVTREVTVDGQYRQSYAFEILKKKSRQND